MTHRHVYAAALAASMSAEAHAIATHTDGLITDCCRALIGPRFGVRWWLAGGGMVWFFGHLLFRWPA